MVKSDSLGMSVSGDGFEGCVGGDGRTSTATLDRLARPGADVGKATDALGRVAAWAGAAAAQAGAAAGASLQGLWAAFGGAREEPLPAQAVRCLLSYVGARHVTRGEAGWAGFLTAMDLGQGTGEEEEEDGGGDGGLVPYAAFQQWWYGGGGPRASYLLQRSAGITSGHISLGTRSSGPGTAPGTAEYISTVMAAAAALGASGDAKGVNAATARQRLALAAARRRSLHAVLGGGGDGASLQQLEGQGDPRRLAAVASHWEDPYSGLVMAEAVHTGGGVRCVDEGTLPNSLYFYRLTSVAGPAASDASAPVPVYTPPLPPFAAVLVDVGPRWARLRWHAAQFGSAKFVVEAALLEVLPAPGMLRKYAGTGVAVQGTVYGGGAGTPDANLQWVVAASTASNFAVVSGLSPNSVYRLRVRGMNAGGVLSAPSMNTEVITQDNADFMPHTPRNAPLRFSVEVPLARLVGESPQDTLLLADIVVGDSISWSEVVFDDGSVVVAASPEAAEAARHDGLPVLPAPTLTSGTRRGTGRLSTSWGRSRPQPVALRQAAAVVVGSALDAEAAASDVAARHTATGEGLGAVGALGAVLSTRTLSLEVLWCTVSGQRQSDDIAWRPGFLVTRPFRSLNDALVRRHTTILREPWEDEEGRWTLMEELAEAYPHLMPLPDDADGGSVREASDQGEEGKASDGEGGDAYDDGDFEGQGSGSAEDA